MLLTGNFPTAWRWRNFSCENHFWCVRMQTSSIEKVCRRTQMTVGIRHSGWGKQERNKWLLSGAGNQDGATILRRLMWMGVSLSLSLEKRRRCCSRCLCVWTRDKCPARDVTDNSRLDNNPLCRRGTAEPRRRRHHRRVQNLLKAESAAVIF